MAPRRLLPMVWLLPAMLLIHGRGERLELRRPAAAPASAGRPRRPWRSSGAVLKLLLAGAGGAHATGTGDLLGGRDDFSGTFVSEEGFLDAARQKVLDMDPETAEQALIMYRRLFQAADMDGDGRLNDLEAEYSAFLATEAVRKKSERKEADAARVDEKTLGSTQAWWSTLNAEGEEGGEVLEFGRSKRFKQIDLDRDGLIRKDEYWGNMAAATVTLGWQERPHEDPDVEQWMHQVWETADVSGDGMWSEREFSFGTFLIGLAIDTGKFLEKSLVSDMFQQMDANGDGRIDVQEVTGALAHDEERRRSGGTEAREKPTPLQSMRFYFDTADEDQDGALDRREALKLAGRIVDESYES